MADTPYGPTPEQKLNTIAKLAQSLLAKWPAYRAISSLLGKATVAAGGQSDHRGSGQHADPTADVVASHQPYNEADYCLTEALGLMRIVQREQSRVHGHTIDFDARQRQARCDGSVDPTCVNNAVKNGLCWKCIKRRQRQREREEALAALGGVQPSSAPDDVLAEGVSSHCPPEVANFESAEVLTPSAGSDPIDELLAVVSAIVEAGHHEGCNASADPARFDCTCLWQPAHAALATYEASIEQRGGDDPWATASAADPDVEPATPSSKAP